jgi:hypothetical protein
MSYTVYSRVGNRFFQFDEKDEAERFYVDLPGDAILLEEATIVADKKQVNSFEDLIRASVFIQHRVQATITAEDIQAYEKVQKYISAKKLGLLLTGSVGIGKGTLMKTMSMCAEHIFKSIEHFPVIELREIFILFQEERHKAFEMLGLKEQKIICIDNITEEYLIIKGYGNTTNVLGELVEERYSIFERYGIFTHFVTNLSHQTLRTTLGERRYNLMLRMVSELNMKGDPKNIGNV